MILLNGITHDNSCNFRDFRKSVSPNKNRKSISPNKKIENHNFQPPLSLESSKTTEASNKNKNQNNTHVK